MPLVSFSCTLILCEVRASQLTVAAAAKSLQSCLTLCDPIDGSPPGSPVPGILQARTPEWAAISFSNAWKWQVKVKSLSRVRLFATPWTAAHQAPPSMLTVEPSAKARWLLFTLPATTHFFWTNLSTRGLSCNFRSFSASIYCFCYLKI